MTKLRKPVIRALEAIEQLVDELRDRLGDILLDIRDLLNIPTPPRAPRRKKKRAK